MTKRRTPPAAQFWSMVYAVKRQATQKVEVDMLDGTIAVIYRVNEHVPVRVDFKPKERERQDAQRKA